MNHSCEIKAILWDFGDTLVTLVPSRAELFIEAAACLGMDLPKKIVRDAYRLVDFSNKFSSVNNASPEAKKQFYIQYNMRICMALGLSSHFPELQPILEETFKKKRWELVPNATAILENLNSYGIPMAIVANWDSNLRQLTKQLGIDNLFRTILSSQECGVEKPDSHIFRLALQQLGIPADKQILYVGNEYESDVVGSQEAGLTAVLIDNNQYYPHADCLRFDSIKHWFDALDFEKPGDKLSDKQEKRPE